MPSSVLKKISGVGALTLLSRVFGFLRDIVMAAILGAGALADAFMVALRLPNHFRAIFAEGAFSTAYIPAYSHALETSGAGAAKRFSGQLLALMLGLQLLLLVAVLAATPTFVGLLAPGLAEQPAQFALAVELTRITFPYLLCMALLSVLAGTLNAHSRYAAAAAAPILLNLCMLGTLLAAGLFASPSHAAAWGVCAAGVAELVLVAWAAGRVGLLPPLHWPDLNPPMQRFWRALGPATLGSMGVQLALFADTIIGSLLPGGALSALYYADRINQLPIGVIGIAAGTVVLPEMARRLAAGDEAGARATQNRTLESTLLFALPCVVAFVCIPQLIMQALFGRGAFDAAAASAAAATLLAYAIGLLPFVLIRSVVASFTARGDTYTPLRAALAGIALNVALKIALMDEYAQVGLALATSAGAWLNLLLAGALAWRAGLLRSDPRLWRMSCAFVAGGTALALLLDLGAAPLADWSTVRFGSLGDELALLALAATGAVLYFGVVRALRGWALRSTAAGLQ